MMSALGDVVRLGGLALQSEDCAIRAAVHHRGEHGGLVRMENERHHQFVIWRAVLPVWHAEIEREGNTDIILCRDGYKHYFEMKTWRKEKIPDVQSDIDKKLSYRSNSYVLITSCNPSSSTTGDIQRLKNSLRGIDDTRREFYQFDTCDKNGASFHFWLIGWPVMLNKRDLSTS